MVVIKRDQREVDFDKRKITHAVLAAFKSVDGKTDEYARTKAEKIAEYIQSLDRPTITVEEIQDLVEHGLMSTKRKDVARAYIVYREERTKAREAATSLMKEVKEKLEASNVLGQNANVDERSFGGRKGEAGDAVMSYIALNYLISDMARENHENNRIYIHDRNSYAVGMHNCCARETKFCTANNGVRSFLEYENGDNVEVITPFLSRKNATVRKYGKQKLNKITFSFAGQRFITERFTSNHRWLLSDKTETTNLKIGDKLLKAPTEFRGFHWETSSEKEKYYWCLGFVLADGTEAYRWSHGKKDENIKFVRLRLCGDKIKYEPRFANLKHSTKEMDNGDLYLTFSSIIGFRKIFPNLDEMTRYEKRALMAGLYDADGQHVGSRKSIMTTNEQIASFIEDEAPALGWYILNIKDRAGETTNYATRGFCREYTFIGDSNKYYWTVTDIQEDAEEEVWCLEVEDDHSFILPNGIVTGNCMSIPFDDLLANGFEVRPGADIRPAKSIDTAFQLLVVIFQLQSLQQFGGCSATHLDWTMVPYVRKSFYKHFVDGMQYIQHPGYPFELLQHDLPIEDEYYKSNELAYKYAMDMTKRELSRAVKGMYHNLK